jgi:hypothetical protein
MTPIHRLLLVSLAVSIAVTACSDANLVTPSTMDVPGAPELLLGWQNQVQEADRGTRYDAPYWYMTDDELASAISEVDGRVLIGFKNPGDRGGVDNDGVVLASEHSVTAGLEFLRVLGIDPQVKFEIGPAVAATVDPDLVGVIRRHPTIDYIEPDQPIEFRSQITGWNIYHVNADVAWSRSTGAGQRLLIIDTGVGEHPDLHVSVYHACDGSAGRDVNDNIKWGHGTAVAGVAAALNNTIGSVGVAHGVTLWSSRSFTRNHFICAMEFARMNSVFSINFSGTLSSSAGVTDQINGAWNQGLMFFAPGDTYPGTLANAIGVNAVNASNQRIPGGGSGPGVELVAPGQGVPSSNVKTGSITLYDGESFAVPHVSAAAAILKAYHPSWTNQRVRQALQQTAVDLGAPGKNDHFGYGLLDINAALDHVPPLTAWIQGPGYISEAGQYSWEAMHMHGTAPFTYQWSIRYDSQGSWGPLGSNKSVMFTVEGSDNFTLRVTVTSSDSQSATPTLYVENSAGCPPPEIIC